MPERRRRRADGPGDGLDPRPLMLDQLSSGELMRAASGRLAPDLHVATPAPDRSHGRIPLPRLSKRALLPAGLLAFGLFSSAGLVAGALHTIGDGGVTRGDLVRLAIMGLVTLSVAGQALGALRALPAGRRLLARAGRLRPRRRANEVSGEWQAFLLDQVTSEQLASSAGDRLAHAKLVTVAASAGRRAAGRASWSALIFAAMALAASAAMALAAHLASVIGGEGPAGVGFALEAAFFALSAVGAVTLGRVGWRSLSDASLRRPGRIATRVGRYALGLAGQGSRAVGQATAIAAGGVAVSTPLTVAVVTAATVTVAGLGFAPEITQGIDNIPVLASLSASPTTESGGGGDAGGRSASDDAPSGGTPLPGATLQAGGTPVSTKTASESTAAARTATKGTATPAGKVTSTPAKGTPTPSLKATATAAPKATATPAPKATATTAKATATSAPKATSTPLPKATDTPVPKATSTPVPKATATLAPKPTATVKP